MTYAVLKPLAITDAMLLATDVPETDALAWNAATNYAVGDEAQRTGAGQHKVYRCAVAGVDATPPEDNPTKWKVRYPTNPWRLLDLQNTTRTSKAGGFYYELLPGDAIAGFYLGDMVDVYTVRGRLIDPTTAAVYYDTGEIDVTGSPQSSDWWAFWFGTWTATIPQLQRLDLPAYPTAKFRLDVTGGAACSIGTLLIGPTFEFGRGIRFNAGGSIKDYSRQTENDYGDLDLQPGPYSRLARWSVQIRLSEVDTLFDFLASLRATPALHVGYSDLRMLSVFGTVRSFDIPISNAALVDCSLDLRGIVSALDLAT